MLKKFPLPFRRALLLLPLVTLVLTYQNCGGGYTIGNEELKAMHIMYSGSCEAALMNLYRDSYYPMLTKQCGSCHTHGPGIGNFGASDFQDSFDAFLNTTRERVERNAVNAAHQPPRTGPVNQPLVDRSRPRWIAAEAEYTACLTREGRTDGSSVLTLGKADARIVSAGNNWTRITWNLESEVAVADLRGQYPLTASIEVRVATVSQVKRGYEFRNPLVRLNSTTKAGANIQGLRIYMNGSALSDVTTYQFVNANVVATTDTNLLPGAANAFQMATTQNAGDSFALSFSKIQMGVPIPAPTPVGGTPTPTPVPVTATFTELMGNDNTKNVFKRACANCHSTAQQAGGLDITDFAKASNAGSSIVLRMNNAAKPMPTSGLLPAADRALVEAWVNAGTPR